MPKILWLEDYEDLTDALSILFEVRGYDVRVCQNSSDFWSVGSNFYPDVIIVDIKLEGSEENGFDILENLKKSPWAIVPVIVFSGYIIPAYKERALELGATEYVLKPVRFSELRTAVDRALEKASIRPASS